MSFYKIVLIVLFCHFNSLDYGHCFHQPELPSFGDFIEYYLSLPLSCPNLIDNADVKNAITTKFADCTTKISSSSHGMFGNLKSICENQDKYLGCWDQLKEDIGTNCNESGHLPAVYSATVKSLCGIDEGNTTISNLSNSILLMTQKDRDNCPEETGTHWRENCESLIEGMVSKNLCDRHDAIDKCIGKITCLNFEFGRLQKQLYSNGKAYLNCGS